MSGTMSGLNFKADCGGRGSLSKLSGAQRVSSVWPVASIMADGRTLAVCHLRPRGLY